MTDKEKVAELSALVKAASTALKKAENFADENGLEFSFYPAYGMGGYYIGANHPERDEIFDEDYTDAEDGQGFWNPSSQGC